MAMVNLEMGLTIIEIQRILLRYNNCLRMGVVDIYVLECEDGNIYVGKTTEGIKRLEKP